MSFQCGDFLNIFKPSSSSLETKPIFCALEYFYTLTSEHGVFSEERKAEDAGQHRQRRTQSRESLRKAAGLRTEAGKRAHAHDAVGVATKDVVLIRVQFCRLHQLPRPNTNVQNQTDKKLILLTAKVRPLGVKVQGEIYLHWEIIFKMFPHRPAPHKISSSTT